MNRRPSVVNVLWVVLAVVALAVAVRVIPVNGQRGSTNPAEPRPVASRGSIAADEEATIQLFEKARGSVVYITTQERVLVPPPARTRAVLLANSK